MSESYRAKFLNEYGIDHTAFKVADTPKMADIARQIALFQDQYDKLKTTEQKRDFESYKAKLREIGLRVLTR